MLEDVLHKLEESGLEVLNFVCDKDSFDCYHMDVFFKFGLRVKLSKKLPSYGLDCTLIQSYGTVSIDEELSPGFVISEYDETQSCYLYWPTEMTKEVMKHSYGFDGILDGDANGLGVFHTRAIRSSLKFEEMLTRTKRMLDMVENIN